MSCGPKIQSDGFVPWCKITVTVRELFGIKSFKITVTVSGFNCFGINTVIICYFTVVHQNRRDFCDCACHRGPHKSRNFRDKALQYHSAISGSDGKSLATGISSCDFHVLGRLMQVGLVAPPAPPSECSLSLSLSCSLFFFWFLSLSLSLS